MKIAIIQICSGYGPQENLKKINDFIQKAKKESEIEAVFLPEVFYSMSDGTKATEYLVEDRNEHFNAISRLAKDNGVYLIGGSAATKTHGKITNRVYNFSPEGELLNTYDKMHLFRVDLSVDSSKTVIDEASVYDSGNEPQLLNIDEWNIGLAVCFDVRFPELFRKYFTAGANLLSISAAFTVPTGKAHWETLLRARAIENQSYVVASAQWGEHNEKIKTYGHSLIINPWGEVIGDAGEGEGFICAQLQMDEVRKIRSRMDVSPKSSW